MDYLLFLVVDIVKKKCKQRHLIILKSTKKPKQKTECKNLNTKKLHLYLQNKLLSSYTYTAQLSQTLFQMSR